MNDTYSSRYNLAFVRHYFSSSVSIVYTSINTRTLCKVQNVRCKRHKPIFDCGRLVIMFHFQIIAYNLMVVDNVNINMVLIESIKG